MVPKICSRDKKDLKYIRRTEGTKAWVIIKVLTNFPITKKSVSQNESAPFSDEARMERKREGEERRKRKLKHVIK
jgi:hypothetical protein